MKTLLIEDSDADVNLIRIALKGIQAPIELHVVDDGVKALEFLRGLGPHSGAPRPDFILLDLSVPRRTGLEVLRDVKQDPALRQIPVIVLTGSRATADVVRAYELHATAYFVKPPTGLEQVLKEIVSFLGAAQLPREGQVPATVDAVPGEAEAGRVAVSPSEDGVRFVALRAPDRCDRRMVIGRRHRSDDRWDGHYVESGRREPVRVQFPGDRGQAHPAHRSGG